jgi:phosphatidylinositol alpha-1,6-mannosyltransferase
MILTLQTTTFSAYGGIPAYNQLVCRVLNELGEAIESRVLLASDGAADIEPRKADFPDVRLEAFARDRAALVRRVMRIAICHRIDLLLVGHVNYAGIGWLLRRLLPDLRYGVMTYGVEVWGKLSYLRRRGLRQADFLVSISEYTKRRVVENHGVKPELVHLLPNALAWDAQTAAQRPANIFLPAGSRLLSVCRLDREDPYKGVDTVIKALPGIVSHVPDIQYLVIGGGTDLERHKELASSVGVADRVHFLGFVDEASLHAYYKACEVFVMPSGGEGFGFVFLEAMQFGKPVIAANSGGAPEVVLDGTTGLLVQYGNTVQIVQAICDLCRDARLRTTLGEAGYRRLHESFTFSRFRHTLRQILMHELSSAARYRTQRSLLCSKSIRQFLP